LIFITTGTSLPDDVLIKKLDELKGCGKIPDVLYAQIGNGKYIPKNMKWRKFVRNMKDAYELADIIISNCGAGTIMENVVYGRRLIVVQNPGVIGGHEWELASKLEKLDCLLWCKNAEEILFYIETARYKQFKKFEPAIFNLSLIRDLLEDDKKNDT